MTTITQATQHAIDTYGPEHCLEAHRLNEIDGEGANTIAQLLGYTDHLTLIGNRLCNAGREITEQASGGDPFCKSLLVEVHGTTNVQTFVNTLARHYAELFVTDSEYAYSAARITPEALAAKMTAALVAGTANKDGAGIKRTCKELGISYTYGAIATYITEPQA